MSEALKLILAKLEDEMRSHGIPVETINYFLDELSNAIQSEAWRPTTIQEIAQEAAKIYVSRIEVLEADQRNNNTVHGQIEERLQRLEQFLFPDEK